MKGRPSSSSWLWWLLPLLPIAAVLLLLVPPLGDREEGYLPEVVAPNVHDANDFHELTLSTRWFAGSALAASSLAGAAFCASLARTWRGRLRSLDPRQVSDFRTLAHRRMVAGALAALVVGSVTLAVSPLRDFLSAWAALPLAFVVTAIAQFFTFLLAATATRRLYRGGLS